MPENNNDDKKETLNAVVKNLNERRHSTEIEKDDKPQETLTSRVHITQMNLLDKEKQDNQQPEPNKKIDPNPDEKPNLVMKLIKKIKSK
jgi:hypothetical protein